VSLEVAPRKKEEKRSAGSLDPEVFELLRRLLVGELVVKVDPVSGQAVRDGRTPSAQDRP
jgi:hypothetical protein